MQVKPYQLLGFCVFSGLAAVLFCIRLTERMPKAQAARQSAAPAVNRKTPVLLELFTSEGCSSCPPADTLLARLDHDQPVPNADIIVLSEHVDYWNRLGWQDRFSSPEMTQRQRDYQESFKLDDSYTPQAIVNGSTQFVGNDERGIRRAIEHATDTSAIPLQLASVKVHRNEVTFDLTGDLPATSDHAEVYAALVDPVATTAVHAGENNGRTLHHAGVARAFGRVGNLGRTNASGLRTFSIGVNQSGQFSPLTSVNGMRLVVFVQKKSFGPVLGAMSCLLVPAGPTATQAAFPSNPCPMGSM
jgi:hypothetical protein